MKTGGGVVQSRRREVRESLTKVGETEGGGAEGGRTERDKRVERREVAEGASECAGGVWVGLMREEGGVRVGGSGKWKNQNFLEKK